MAQGAVGFQGVMDAPTPEAQSPQPKQPTEPTPPPATSLTAGFGTGYMPQMPKIQPAQQDKGSLERLASTTQEEWLAQHGMLKPTPAGYDGLTPAPPGQTYRPRTEVIAAQANAAKINQDNQHWNEASALNKIVQKAPYLANHPEILWAIVHNENLKNTVNPQDIAGVLKAKSLYDAAMRSYGEQTYLDFRQAQESNVPVTQAFGQGLQDAVAAVPGGTTFEKDVLVPTMGFIGKVLGAHPMNWAVGLDDKANKEVQSSPVAAVDGLGAVSQISNTVLHTLQGIFSEPAHFYRYYETVKQLHGEDAAIKATMPMVLGATASVAASLVATATPGAEEVAPELAVAGASLGDIAAAATEAGTTTEEMSAIAKALQDLKEAAAKLREVKANATDAVEETAAYQKFLQMKMAFEEKLAPVTKFIKPVTDITGRVVNKYTIAGTELSGQIGGQVVYPEIWQATQDGTKWAKDHPNLAPTFGQALFGRHNFASGAVDFLMAVGGQDPLGAAGNIVGGIRSAEGLGKEGSLINKIFSGTAFDNVDVAYERSSGVKNALNSIVDNIDSPAAINRIDQRLVPISGILSLAKVVDAAGNIDKAATLENVKSAFKQLSAMDEVFTTGKLPSSSAILLRVKQADFKGKGLLSFMPMFRDFSGLREEWGIRSDTFTLGDRAALGALSNGLRHIGFSQAIADEVINHLYKTHDLGEWMNVYKSVVKGKFQIEMVKAIAGEKATMRLAPTDLQGFLHENRLDAFLNEFDTSVNNAVERATSNAMGYGGVNVDGKYATSIEGSDLSGTAQPGEAGLHSLTAGIYADDLGRIKFLNYSDFRKEAHVLVKQFNKKVVKELDVPLKVALREHYADFVEAAAKEGIVYNGDETLPALDFKTSKIGMKASNIFESMHYYVDATQGMTQRGTLFLNKWVNDKIFKPLALATGGWATRVSASEGLLNAMRQGPINLTLARLATAGARHERAVKYWGADLDRRSVLDMAARISYVIGTKVFRVEDSNLRWISSEEEMGSMIAAVHGIMAGLETSILKGLGKQEFMDAAIASLYLNDGHIAPQMVEGGHSMVNDTSLPAKGSAIGQDTSIKDQNVASRYFVNRRDRLGTTYSKKVRISNDSNRIFGPNEDGYVTRRLMFANRILRDPAMQKAVPVMYATYQRRLEEGASQAEAFSTAMDAGITAHYNFMQSLPEATRKIFVRQNGWFPTDITWVENHPGLRPLPTDSPEEILRKSSLAHSTVAIDGFAPLIVGAGKIDSIGGQYFDERLFRDIAYRQVKNKTWQSFAKTYHTDAEGNALTAGHFNQITGGSADSLNGPGFSNIFAHFGENVNEKLTGNIVSRLSREPIFIVEFANQRKLTQKLVERAGMTQEQADTLALARASQEMVRFVHNPHDKLKFEYGMRVFAPFYFAQNQSWRRMARLGVTDIGAFERYLRTISQVLNYSYTAGKSQGGYPSIQVPGSAWLVGFMTKMLGASVPIGLNLSLSSAQSVLPISPQESGDPSNALTSPSALLHSLIPRGGPMIALPLKYVVPFVSPFTPAQLQRIDDLVLGPAGESSSILQDFLPNSFVDHVAQTVLGAVGAAFGQNGTNVFAQGGFESSYITASNESWRYLVEQKLQSFMDTVAQAHPKLPQEQQAQLALEIFTRYYNPKTDGQAAKHLSDLMSEVNTATFTRSMVRAAFGFFSPLSTSMSQANPTFVQAYQNLVTQLNGDYVAAQDQMFKNDPTMAPFSLLTTTTAFQNSKAQGANYPETKPALDWMQRNYQLVSAVPAGARYLMPLGTLQSPTNPYYALGALYQMQQQLRQRRTPAEMQQQLNITIGNYLYYNVIEPAFTAEKGGSSYEGYRAAEAWAKQYGPVNNNDWLIAHEAGASKGNRVAIISQIQEMMTPGTQANKLAKNQPLFGQMKKVYNEYQNFANNIAPQYSSADRGRIAKFGNQVGWQGFDALKAEYPQMTTFITDVLQAQYPYFPKG